MFKTFKNNPLIYLIHKLWINAESNRPNMIKYLGLFIMANGIKALEPLLIGLFLNLIQSQGITAQNITYLCLLLLIFPLQELAFWLFHGFARVIENKNSYLARNNYKRYLMKGVMSLPIEWQTDHHSGNTIDKIEKGAQALWGFGGRTFEIIEAFILLTTSIAVLVFFDWKAGALVAIISIVTFGILLLFDKVLIPGYRKMNQMENSISAKVFDVLSNVTTVIILRIEALVFKSFSDSLNKPLPQYEENIKLNEWKWFAASIMGRIAVVVGVATYMIIHVKTGVILVGTLYMLYGYTNQIRNVFFKFAYLYNDIVRYRTSVENSEELAKDFELVTKTENEKLPTSWKTVEIKDLSFSYHTEDNADLHIDSVSLAIHRGEHIAVIGESGGGKSTFLKLIRDLYHPKFVNIFIDGQKVSDGFQSISESISLIPQDPEIFATTIRENITLGVDYTDEHIQKFTDIAQFTNVAKGLPNGLESSIVEKGVNLSGGEKQRLALTRGLLASKDKDIILLDEPTSSVDTTNELTIYQNIFKAFSDKTIISSIHRLHLLKFFDIIYFFRDGKIIISGTFEELKEKSPEFQVLWKNYTRTEHIKE